MVRSGVRPTRPGAQCQLKGPLAVGVKLLPDNCSCTGYSEAACAGAAGYAPDAAEEEDDGDELDEEGDKWNCSKACPAAVFPESFNVECGMQRRGFTLPDTPVTTETAAGCSSLCGTRTDCVAWSCKSALKSACIVCHMCVCACAGGKRARGEGWC